MMIIASKFHVKHLLLIAISFASIAAAEEPKSFGDLFEIEKEKSESSVGGKNSSSVREDDFTLPPIKGFLQSELAYTWPGPGHWSKFRNIFEVGSKGEVGKSVNWVANIRFTYDPIYDLTNYYSSSVRNDQRFDFSIRETYLDFSAGDWDFRVGRQHIIWGEMVGLFVADVVSAKDLRQFILPDFDLLRIPQWAIRSEYFHADLHAEFVWVPVPTVNDIGKVGSEFYPFTTPDISGFRTITYDDKAPSQTLGNSAYGVRTSYLKNGWDASLFYYSTPELSPSFRRTVRESEAVITFTPIHKRIQQFGVTMAKDISRTAVFKAEAVYSMGRPLSVTDQRDSDGLVGQDILDYIAGIDYTLEELENTRFNIQFFQSVITDWHRDVVADRVDSGVSFLFSTRALHPKLEPEVLYVHGFNHNDWMLQTKLTWEFTTNWRWVNGIDAFGGGRQGVFGQYNEKDRIYSELRFSF
ncbi:DUF1302 family protein [Methylococcus sp. EFPC2]|uniref:DUF1302 family protein n=1 Tax=Methylococcus sp. EFPC2 TaxID=2812648 RepID=UPI0019674127|nr:DUF1302 family protein [Methylococcus sp. EFPC2]QSA95688.1 hypothetical protein JWZ97_10540 [Methylococcus sp. EFPC2]